MRKFFLILVSICIMGLTSISFCNDRDFPVVRSSVDGENEIIKSELDE